MIRALWATPRTVSTAFERMVIERGDHLVLDEPWSRAYYLGPDRRSERFPLCFPESTYAAVTAGVVERATEAADRIGADVFVKDMAYQALPGLEQVTDDELAGWHHTFLVRRPAAALASLHEQWPDFTDDEAGYSAQVALHERVRSVDARWIVIDSDALGAEPEAQVARWAAHAGLDHRPESLRWGAGLRPEWPLWTEWYDGVAASTGFRPSTRRADRPPPGRGRLVDDAERAYRTLLAHAST